MNARPSAQGGGGGGRREEGGGRREESKDDGAAGQVVCNGLYLDPGHVKLGLSVLFTGVGIFMLSTLG